MFIWLRTMRYYNGSGHARGARAPEGRDATPEAPATRDLAHALRCLNEAHVTYGFIFLFKSDTINNIQNFEET